MQSASPSSKNPERGARALRVIGIFKIIKGTFILAGAVGMFRLMHKDVSEVLWHWIDILRIDPGNRYVGALLEKAGLIDPRSLERIGILSMFYSLLFYIEGIGLWRRKRWGEWITVIVTGSFVPIEIYEVVKKPGPIKITFFSVNLAILIFLIVLLRKGRRHEDASAMESFEATR